MKDSLEHIRHLAGLKEADIPTQSEKLPPINIPKMNTTSEMPAFKMTNPQIANPDRPAPEMTTPSAQSPDGPAPRMTTPPAQTPDGPAPEMTNPSVQATIPAPRMTTPPVQAPMPAAAPSMTTPLVQAPMPAAAPRMATPPAAPTTKFQGTIKDFQAQNPGATVGQALNAIQGKTARQGGANDPSVIQGNIDKQQGSNPGAGPKAYNPGTPLAPAAPKGPAIGGTATTPGAKPMKEDADLAWMLDKIKKMGLMESDPGQAIMLISSLKTSMEHLESLVQGGRGNPMQVISQMENALDILKQHFDNGSR